MCRYVKFVTVQNGEKLDLEQAKMIAQLRTVRPEGLNPSLEFNCREDWYEFATWYKVHRVKDWGGTRGKEEWRQ